MIYDWLVDYLFPLFVDVSTLTPDQLNGMCFFFSLFTLYIVSYLFVYMPFKLIRRLLRGDRK